MAGGIASTLRDTNPLVSGTYSGPNGVLSITDDKDFKSCGVVVGLAIRNTTDVSSGLITAVSEKSITFTLTGGTANTMTEGDEYEIYKTTTYNSKLSTHYEDRRYGHKFVNPDQLVDGIPADELDVDEYERNVFSSDQPMRNPRGY